MIKIGDKRYETIKEHAKSKGKSIQTVYNWIKNKQVKTKVLMNQTLIEL